MLLSILIPTALKDKKRIKFSKYKVFKHTTESKRKNMVGNNPEVEKRKGIQAAFNPVYTSDSTIPGQMVYSSPEKGQDISAEEHPST